MIVKEILIQEDKNKVYQTYRVNKWIEKKIENLLSEIYHLDYNISPFVIEEITKCDLEELHSLIIQHKIDFHRKTEKNNIESLKQQRNTVLKEITQGGKTVFDDINSLPIVLRTPEQEFQIFRNKAENEEKKVKLTE